jgi:hypothetical protein
VTPCESVHYLGFGTATNFTSLATVCGGFGGIPASVHTENNLRSISQAAEQVIAMANSPGNSTQAYWLYGTSTAGGSVSYLDGTRFLLNVSLPVRSGCVALMVTNDTATVSLVPCDGLAFPICAFHQMGAPRTYLPLVMQPAHTVHACCRLQESHCPDAALTWRNGAGDSRFSLQADSHEVVHVQSVLSQQDAQLLCRRLRGASLLQPYGARGRDLLVRLSGPLLWAGGRCRWCSLPRPRCSGSSFPTTDTTCS